MRVVICGPNLCDQSKGQFHVHKEGCADLRRGANREPEYRNGWTIEADSREDIVNAIYSGHMAEREPGTFTWHDFDDSYVFPCCGDLAGRGPMA